MLSGGVRLLCEFPRSDDRAIKWPRERTYRRNRALSDFFRLSRVDNSEKSPLNCVKAAQQFWPPDPHRCTVISFPRTTQPAQVRGQAHELAGEARRRGLLAALTRIPGTMMLAGLTVLTRGRYADELAEFSVEQLTERVPRRILMPRAGESIEDAIMRVFRALPRHQLGSRFFMRRMGLQRWTVAPLLAELAERGWLVRAGKTSDTVYWLAPQLSEPMSAESA